MRLSIISFTKNGKRLSESIAKILEKDMAVRSYTKCEGCMGDSVDSSVLPVKSSVGDWAKERMEEREGMLFIGGCGIAVRAVAPFLTDKLHDAPVLVMDEKGKYIIPILSGHMGGANMLANLIAGKMGAEPVITTATDINQKFAVDLFAKRNGLYIVNKEGIAKVSSKVLAGKKITLSVEPGHGIDEKTCLPVGIRLVPYPPAISVDILVTSEECEVEASASLKPQEYVIGVGCKRGKRVDEIDNFIAKKINELGISVKQILALASISQKRDEQGMIEWCQRAGTLFLTYTAEELRQVEGDFTESSFVKARVGVDNVCERAALRGCGEGGKLIAPKYAEDGMTVAIAKRKWKVCFDGE